MSSATSAVTPAEAYAQWGERIRCLFAAPPSALDTTVTHSPFERHTCAVPLTPASMLPDLPCAPAAHAVGDRVSQDEPVGATSETGYFYDEALYPFCFYTRLLQERVATPQHTDLHAAQTVQHLPVDDDELALRLAHRLHARTRDQVVQRHRMPGATPGKLVSSFCDPRVEEQQARLHSELTDLLLEVRAKNEASAVLRRQLLRSRVVQGRVHGAEDMAGCAALDAEIT